MNIIRIKSKHCEKDKITYKNKIINLKTILNDEELNYYNDMIKYLLKNEYLFNTGMSDNRIIYLYELIRNLEYIKEEIKVPFKRKNEVKLDAIVVGAQRCATTWFYNICKKINFIDVARKEPSFFSTYRYCKGYNWYSSLYKSNESINIDVSVNYIYFVGKSLTWIAEYQKKNNIKLKIIYFIRKPSERVNSYIELKKVVGRGWYNQKKYIHSGFIYFYYIRNSDYLNGIIKLEKYFDKNQIFVVFFEDVKKDPMSTFIQILNFIDPEGMYKSLNLKEEILLKKYHASKKIILYPLFKFLIDLEKYLMLKFLRVNYSKLGKMIINFLKIKKILILKKSRQKKRFHRTTIELKELDKKYQNFKNVLEKRNIRFTDV